MKECKICKIEKDIINFQKRGNGKFRNECKDCRKNYLKMYRLGEKNIYVINKEKSDNKICSKCGIEKNLSEFIKQKRICKSCKSLYLKEYYQKNKDKISISSKEYYNQNIEQKKENRRNYAKNNRDKENLRNLKYRKEVLYLDPLFHLKSRLSSRIRKAINKIGVKKSFKTEETLGCSIEFLKEYIENKFEKGMSWENRDLWHIDHITPLSFAESEEEVKILNHYLNLRPMWSILNITKSNKIDKNEVFYQKIILFRTFSKNSV